MSPSPATVIACKYVLDSPARQLAPANDAALATLNGLCGLCLTDIQRRHEQASLQLVGDVMRIGTDNVDGVAELIRREPVARGNFAQFVETSPRLPH
jgi:hypothetical protein